MCFTKLYSIIYCYAYEYCCEEAILDLIERIIDCIKKYIEGSPMLLESSKCRVVISVVLKTCINGTESNFKILKTAVMSLSMWVPKLLQRNGNK